MSNILNFKDYTLSQDFIWSMSNAKLNESSDDEKDLIKKILIKSQKDLGLNVQLTFTFGTGVTYMYPIVKNLISNKSINIDSSIENITLLTLTSLCILSLSLGEETYTDLKKDIRSLLEELKLRGIGNGLVKKLVECLSTISKFIFEIFKTTPYVIRNLLDIFGYTALLIPILGALSSTIQSQGWDINTMVGNLYSLGAGVASIILKNGIDHFISTLDKAKKISTSSNPKKEIEMITEY